ALASEMGVSVQSAPDVTYSSFSIPGGYSEFEVVGQIFALQAGQTSVPLKGDNAVYVVSMTSRTDAPEGGDIAGEKGSLLGRLQSRAESAVLNALREAAGVKVMEASVADGRLTMQPSAGRIDLVMPKEATG
ncbi:MAG: hypothetical protein ACK4L7_09985, partial [Flavobacteriales bacterium]